MLKTPNERRWKFYRERMYFVNADEFDSKGGRTWLLVDVNADERMSFKKPGCCERGCCEHDCCERGRPDEFL